jgi:hypothetical protein
MKTIVTGLALSLALATAPAAKTPVKHDGNGVALYPVGTPGLTKEERRARNIYVVRTSIEGYQVAYRTKSFPKRPAAEQQLERWAPGATMEMGKAPAMPVQHSDPAAGGDFGQIEAMVFWRGTPDWRITDYHIAGDESVVIAATKYEGTMKDGSKPFTWVTDIFYFDDQGRKTRWLEPHADNAVQERWVQQGGYRNYVHGLVEELKAAKMPAPPGLEQGLKLLEAEQAEAASGN